MCIIIDTDTVSSLFDPANKQHSEFEPVLNWILHGKGKLVYGGSTYSQQTFKRMPRFNRLFVELRRRGKAIVVDGEEVDREEQRIKSLVVSSDFDDAHLIAILDVSGCLLLCSNDQRADRFIKKKMLYRRRTNLPHIYRKSRYHKKLLADSNIAACCKPDNVVDREARDAIAGCIPKT